jgi:hypothetical protein
MRPNSQLFMFSDSFCRTIDDWFAGNIVIEQGINDVSETNDKDLFLIVQFLRNVKNLPYTKVTTVLNYNEQGLTFAQISGQFGYMCRLQTKNDYDNLRNLKAAIDSLIQSRHPLQQFKSCLNNSYSALDRVSDADIKAAKKVTDKHLSSLVKENDKLYQYIIDLFDSKFKCGYQQFV